MDDPEYKIVVAGESIVGKSALTLQLIKVSYIHRLLESMGQFVPDCDPTIEDSYRKQCVIDDRVAILDILDTAPLNELNAVSSMQNQYILAGEGFVLVYSICDRSSFNAVHKYHKQILNIKEQDSVPMVLVANKMDREKERVVSTEDGQELAKAIKAGYVETSAMLGTNVNKAFFDLVRSIRRHRNHDNTDTPLNTDIIITSRSRRMGRCILL